MSMRIIILLIALFSTQCATQKHDTAPNRQVQTGLSDSSLLELVQRQTFRYFWDFAHPVSGLALERSNERSEKSDVVTIGGSGFGIMAIVVATERKWITRDLALARLIRIMKFLENTDRYHGIFPHWIHGATGKAIP